MMNIPFLQKIQDVVRQELLDTHVVKLRFGNVDPLGWKVVPQFSRDLSPNGVHSYAYLLQHEDFCRFI